MMSGEISINHPNPMLASFGLANLDATTRLQSTAVRMAAVIHGVFAFKRLSARTPNGAATKTAQNNKRPHSA
jgi:hypothetical protein